MSLDNVKLFYMLSCVILGFIVFLPTFFAVVPLPEGERFSELWLLGSNHMIENGGFNVLNTDPFSVYLGVANNMKAFKFYTVYVKLGNLSDPLPNRTASIPSPLQPIFEYTLFLENGEESEKEIVFSFEDVSFEENICRIYRLSIDEHDVPVDKILVWDELNGGFYCQLIFELWIYNTKTSDFQFHNRSVWFWINLNTLI